MIQMIARFSGIDDEKYSSIPIDYRNLIDISSKITDRSEISSFSFGVISNGGDMHFRDIYDEANNRWVLDYLAENDKLIEGILLNIYLYNSLTKNSELLAEFKTNEWDYDTENRQITVSLNDELEEWQDIEVEAELSNPNNTNNSKPLTYFYEKLYNITVAKGYKIKSFEELDNDTKAHITKLWVNVAIMKSDNLWAQWNKFCSFAQCHLFKSKNIISLYYNGGN